ncbi:hypothetical protein G9A89_020978 [Geosiphon pyriformis]|nr:hypothetical protein G9A89_020978 [Geosiphon pyriformis]
MPSKAQKYVYNAHSKIISGVIAVLESTKEPLSLQELVDEMTNRQLVVFHGATPRNTVSGEISKLLNSVGPTNAPILKTPYSATALCDVLNGKVHKKSSRFTRHSRRSSNSSVSPSALSSSFSSSSDEQTSMERFHQQRKRRQMEDLKAAYLLSCLSAHSFWFNYKNEPEKDFECFLEAHLGEEITFDYPLNASISNPVELNTDIDLDLDLILIVDNNS